MLYIPDSTNLGLNEEHANLFQILTQVSEIANKVVGLLYTIFEPSPDAIALEEKLKSTKLLRCLNEVSATQVSEILQIFLVFWDKFLTGESERNLMYKLAYDTSLNQATQIVHLEHKNFYLTKENEQLKIKVSTLLETDKAVLEKKILKMEEVAAAAAKDSEKKDKSPASQKQIDEGDVSNETPQESVSVSAEESVTIHC